MYHNYKKKDKKKRKVKKEKEETRGSEREKRGERKGKRGFSLLSKIYGNRTIGFHRSKRKSRSMHRELRMGTKILEFRQTPQGREFS